jgi:WD40 repeat protein/nucleoside phosphorylase
MTTPAFFDPSSSPEDPERSVAAARVDVLILTALQDELEAVLALGEGGRAGWRDARDLGGFRYFRRTLPSARGGALSIAAAWIGEMGDRNAAVRGQQLLTELDAGCLAMCGICAGYREKVALGDVIVADQLYPCDEGKLVVKEGAAPEMAHNLRTFDLEATWKMDASFLARELDLAALLEARPPSKEAQQRWLLGALYAHENEGGPAPATHPDRAGRCPGWSTHLKRAVKDGLVAMKGNRLRLTEAGKEKVEEDRLVFPDGPPADPPLRVHVGAIATGHSVQEDPGLFDRLRRLVRTTIGVEMEGVGIAEVATRFRKKSLLIKAVSDHADLDKDDSFRKFACRASAEVLIAFLVKHFEPGEGGRGGEREGGRRREREAQADAEAEGRDAVDVRGGDDRRDSFVVRVEQVAKLREPGAKLTRRRAPSPFSGLLEVEVRQGALMDLRVIGALDQPVTEALVTAYVTEVEAPYRQDNARLGSMLVHTGAQAPVDLARAAWRRGVVLQSFAEYQGLIDFTRYLGWQTGRLEADTIYPPELYVDAPARWSLAGGREEKATEDALATLRELLEEPRRRFGLVLGDFGAGKTFLLHELARRMGKEGSRVVPVLVEMSRLEKQRSLRALLAQHFALADEGRIDLDAFLYMLGQGQIALLFDGFDELALRLTYDRALEHFETVLAAAQGDAKVVVSSRTQHFLADHAVRRELAVRAEVVGGYRLIQLEKFGEAQIRRFLGNLIPEQREAEERYELLHDVRDLLGLSENPRMLGFIAKIEPGKLREARAGGEITAAKLYEILIGQWLEFEHKRVNPPGAPKGISQEKLAELVTTLAGVFWERNARALPLSEFGGVLVAEGVEPAVVEHMIGSGSLLVRDAEGRFSFVHRSVMEWLVAGVAAREVCEKGDAAALGVDEMSELMADFLISLAGREKAAQWAWNQLGSTGEGATKKNAARVLQRIEVIAGGPKPGPLAVRKTVNLEGQDLRGQDWSGADWRGAKLARVNLEGATLRGADLRGADLRGANLRRADMAGAKLAGADGTGAELAFARLMGAELSGARGLAAARMRGAKLVGARGVEVEGLLEVGAVPPGVGEALPMMVPAAPCYAVAWNQAGDLLASGHDDGSVRLWDVVTGEAIRGLGGHTSAIQSVAFSPDGQTLASGSDDNTVRLWDVATGRALRAYEGHTQGVWSVAFSPDGQTLASGSSDQTVRLWDVATGRALRAYEGHASRVLSVAFSPDGQTLASGSYDQTVRLWDVATGRALRAYEGHTQGVWSVAFSPDGQTLASGSWDTTVRLWDVATGRALRAYEGHTKQVLSVAFSPDGQTLASGSLDKTVRLWDVATGRALRAYEGHTSRVQSVAFSPDGQTLASGADDQTVRLWDVATGRALRAYEGHTNWVWSVAFSPDGHTLASAPSGQTVGLWDVVTGCAQSAYGGHGHGAQSVAFDPDGQTLASGSSDTIVRLWDVATGRALRAYEGHTNLVLGVAFSPDGETLASGSDDTTVRLWDVATGRPLRTYEEHTKGVTSVAFSPDGQTLASGSADKTVRLWDVATGRVLRAYEGHTSGVRSVAFSPDGQTLASGADDRAVHLWNVATGRALRAYEGHTNLVLGVAFSPDGQTLASGSWDQTVRLRDVATGRALSTLTGHLGPVTAVAFSPDGLTLASASLDGTLRLWSTATGLCLAILLSLPEGWVAFTPDGRYKLGGDIGGSFWHVVGLCRFEPGELDPYLRNLRVPDDAPLYELPPPPPAR